MNEIQEAFEIYIAAKKIALAIKKDKESVK